MARTRRTAGIDEKYLEPYGRTKAKVDGPNEGAFLACSCWILRRTMSWIQSSRTPSSRSSSAIGMEWRPVRK